jgi:hypothetical protein
MLLACSHSVLPADSEEDEARSDEEGEDLNPPRRNIKIEDVTVRGRHFSRLVQLSV